MAVPLDVDVVPRRWSGAIFEGKAWVLRLQRALRDTATGRPSRQNRGTDLCEAPLLAEFRSRLWPRDEGEQMLVAGKLQNLRVAARHLHGVEVPAGQIFSFWRQVGRATARRGFAVGRELREGCLIPAIGGGLCQLSNAIYDCAVRAGLVVIERHRHSRVLPGSLAEQDRDATVFWNYIDLRLSAPFPWRLEVVMDEVELRIAIRGPTASSANQLPISIRRRNGPATGDCTSCGEQDCHRHVGSQGFIHHSTWLVDEDWPEFAAHRKGNGAAMDRVITAAGGSITDRLATLHARALRRYLWRSQPVPQARQRSLELLAHRISQRLQPDDLELIVPQGLLPYLWKAGTLGGRRFDVLMTALPMVEIQRRLDAAAQRQGHSSTLRDFRAPPALLEAEQEALSRARRWITPHVEIASMSGGRAFLLDWQLPSPTPDVPPRTAVERQRVLLPASSLARKGVFELRQAMRGIPVQLLLPPGASEAPDFWDGFDVRSVASISAGIADSDVVVLPAWIEHQPRGLLQAIACGKPVIATAACGLPDSLPWHRVEAGDDAGLRASILATLCLH